MTRDEYIQELLNEIAILRSTVQAWRDEVAKLQQESGTSRSETSGPWFRKDVRHLDPRTMK